MARANKFKQKYKDLEIAITITAVQKNGVSKTVARLERTDFSRARSILDIYESILPRDKRFKK